MFAADLYSRAFGSVFLCLLRASIVVILAQCFCIYGEPLNNVFKGVFSFTKRLCILMILAFYAIAVDLFYDVYKGHIWRYFPIRIKEKPNIR